MVATERIEEPAFVLGETWNAFLQRYGLLNGPNVDKYARAGLERRIPESLRTFPLPDIRDKAMRDDSRLRQLHEIEDKAREAIRAAIDAAKDEGMAAIGNRQTLSPGKVADLRDLEEKLKRLGERAGALVLSVEFAAMKERQEITEGGLKEVVEEVQGMSPAITLSTGLQWATWCRS